jgi:hypothetical protein
MPPARLEVAAGVAGYRAMSLSLAWEVRRELTVVPGHLHKLSIVIANATARQILEAKPELASFTFLNYNMNAVHYAAGAHAETPRTGIAQQLCACSTGVYLPAWACSVGSQRS